MPWFADSEALLDEIERFLDGAAPGRAGDRRLATIMVTASADATRLRERIAAHGGHAGRGDTPLAWFDGPARALGCASLIAGDARRAGGSARIGLHTGECNARGETLTGIAVDIAAGIAEVATAGQILATRTVRDLVVGSGISFIDRGDHTLAGIPEPWQLFEVEPPGPDASTLAVPER